MYYIIGILIALIISVLGVLTPFIPKICKILMHIFGIKEVEDPWGYEMGGKLYRHGAEGFKNATVKHYGNFIGEYLLHGLLTVIVAVMSIFLWPGIVALIILLSYIISKQNKNKK